MNVWRTHSYTFSSTHELCDQPDHMWRCVCYIVLGRLVHCAALWWARRRYGRRWLRWCIVATTIIHIVCCYTWHSAPPTWLHDTHTSRHDRISPHRILVSSANYRCSLFVKIKMSCPCHVILAIQLTECRRRGRRVYSTTTTSSSSSSSSSIDLVIVFVWVTPPS